MYKFGDIVILDFSTSKGKEINKLRPALVCSNTIINNNSPFLIVAPISSNVNNILYTHLFLEEDYIDKKSKVIFEQIKSIDKQRVIKKIGFLNESQISESKEKINFCFEL